MQFVAHHHIGIKEILSKLQIRQLAILVSWLKIKKGILLICIFLKRNSFTIRIRYIWHFWFTIFVIFELFALYVFCFLNPTLLQIKIMESGILHIHSSWARTLEMMKINLTSNGVGVLLTGNECPSIWRKFFLINSIINAAVWSDFMLPYNDL